MLQEQLVWDLRVPETRRPRKNDAFIPKPFEPGVVLLDPGQSIFGVANRRGDDGELAKAGPRENEKYLYSHSWAPEEHLGAPIQDL
jgi:hypothetical protein